MHSQVWKVINLQKKYKTVYSTKPNFVPDRAEKSKSVTPAPERQNLKVRLDKKHRRGKAVTLITGFVGSGEDLKGLGKTLKSQCGVGGTVKNGEVLIQGDFRDKIVEILTEGGYKGQYKLSWRPVFFEYSSCRYIQYLFSY